METAKAAAKTRNRIGFEKWKRDTRGRNVFAEGLKSALIGAVLILALALLGVAPAGGRRDAAADASIEGFVSITNNITAFSYSLGAYHVVRPVGNHYSVVILERNLNASAFDLPSAYKFKGYVFMGPWLDMDDAIDSGSFNLSEISSYFPQYHLAKVCWYSGEANVSVQAIYQYEPDAAELPPEPEPPEHYEFSGWYYDEGLTEPYDGGAVYEDTDLYAKFVLKTYYITFSTGLSGATFENRAVTALDGGGAAPTPERYGYTFNGWWYDEGHTGPYNPEEPVTGDTTLYAEWEAVILRVTFYVGGAVYAELDVEYGTTLQAAARALAAQGIYFTYAEGIDSAVPVVSDMSVTGTAEKTLARQIGDFFTGLWKPVGGFFADYWLYFAIAGGCAMALFLTAKILKKARG